MIKKMQEQETMEEKHEDDAQAEDATEEAPIEGEPVEDSPEEKAAEIEEADPQAAQISALTEERDDLQDQLLRARAEFENYRKRMAREAERVRKTASESLLRDLLPVADNLERALSHAEETAEGFSEGVQMVLKQFSNILAGHGVEPIPALGEVFDPNVHEALSRQPSDEHAENTIVEEFQRGYRLNSYILRASQVVVSSGPASEDTTPENGAAEDTAPEK